jgi:polysaccharide biosynthesis protein PslH
MNVLGIVWYKVFPAKYGGQKGIASFHAHLAALLPLTTLCSKDNEPDTGIQYPVLPLLPTGKKQFLNPFVWLKIRSTCRDRQVTHLLVEFPYYGWLASRLKKRLGLKFILHAHNIEGERFKTMRKTGWKWLARYEGWCFRQADLALFKTENDRRYAIEQYGLAAARTHIVPYGVEQGSLPTQQKHQIAGKWLRAKYNISLTEQVFLFCGTLSYPPNAAALAVIETELVPRLQSKGLSFKIIVCGAYQQSPKHSAIVMAGEVPDISPYFFGADLFINPIIQGGGVQTKILEAIAHNLTVITTSLGATGIPALLAGKKLHAAATGNWDAFTSLLLEQSGQQHNTPPEFYHYYAWPAIARQAAEKIKAL